ncbi:ATP-binding response regulator [Butyricimonas hominis]|uniref:ATP-binding response regulator n=1 Tax=Butyricimonas hominis TaxID=2763032 RepID=UPI00344FFD25
MTFLHLNGRKIKVTTIFDRFTKLNTFARGSGLGLAICKMLVEKMGGDISVESEGDKGSIFKFTIPYQEIAIETGMNDMENNETKESVSAGRTILVAEDVESNYLLLKAIIGKIYTLVHAWDGQEAIDLFKQSNPDLILMDIKMPVLDGLAATRVIRAESKEVPIIALTAFAFDDDRVKALEAGCNDYLTKPLSANLLKETIAKYLK